jgi:hypothetical protein
MEHLGSQWKYLHEIGYLTVFRNSVEKIQVLLYLGKNNWYCTCRPMYRGADKSLARPGREQATATEDFEFHISYL